MTTPKLLQEAYFLDIWRSCGEASTRECKDCPVPVDLCNKWTDAVGGGI